MPRLRNAHVTVSKFACHIPLYGDSPKQIDRRKRPAVALDGRAASFAIRSRSFAKLATRVPHCSRPARLEQVLQRRHLFLLHVQQFSPLLLAQPVQFFMEQHDLEFGLQIDFVIVFGRDPVLV